MFYSVKREHRPRGRPGDPQTVRGRLGDPETQSAQTQTRRPSGDGSPFAVTNFQKKIDMERERVYICYSTQALNLEN